MADWLTQLTIPEQNEVALAQFYKDNLNHGTDAHLALTVIDRLTDLLNDIDQPVLESGIVVSDYSLPVRGQASEWYFASTHHQSWIGNKKPHSGIDINLRKQPRGDVELGYPAFSTCAGLVVYAQYAPGSYWGNLVITVSSYSEGLLLWRYAHLDGVAVGVGDILAAGDALGTIGKGANERYAAHLHLDCWTGPMVGVPPGAWFDRRVTWLDPLKVWSDAGYDWNWGKA